MKKKGFTLVELLAVIVVLAIIAIIAIPLITGVIDKARRGSFKSSALGIMEAGELYVATHNVDYNESGTIIFTCNGSECTDVEGNKLSFKGEVPISGTVIVNKKGVATVRELTNGKYCITGERTSLTITKDCKEQVLTPPSITVTGEEVENSGYYLSQKATVVFDNTNAENPEFFVKTTKNGVSNISVTDECGNKTNPGSCNQVEGTNVIKANIWYKVSGNIEVTYSDLSEDNGTIVAIMKDGDIYINSNVESIGKITKETNYTLNHHQMNEDGETYTLVESETLTGYAYMKVTPELNTYEGFTGKETQEVSISPDGLSIVDYYYDRNKYTIEYVANGGSGTMTNTTCTYGVACALRANAFTKSGYVFNGWTGSNGGSYTNGQSVTNLTSQNGGVITMTAKWKQDTAYATYTISRSTGGDVQWGQDSSTGYGGRTYTNAYCYVVYTVNTSGYKYFTPSLSISGNDNLSQSHTSGVKYSTNGASTVTITLKAGGSSDGYNAAYFSVSLDSVLLSN